MNFVGLDSVYFFLSTLSIKFGCLLALLCPIDFFKGHNKTNFAKNSGISPSMCLCSLLFFVLFPLIWLEY